jgi:hypothetical protein
MTDWNFDISAAPRGHYVEETLPGRSGSVRTIRKHAAPKVILATKCKKVIQSKWLPPDDSERRPIGRWEMLNAGEEPVAWMPWPSHPEVSDV